MSLRPRYSLLTLLVLTALVSGGVKLWYGPHHGVMRHESQGLIYENEGDFTREWDGRKLGIGTSTMRVYSLDGTLQHKSVSYYAGRGVPGGITAGWYELTKVPAEVPVNDPPTDHWHIVQTLMSREEYDNLRTLLLHELKRDVGPGFKWKAQLNVPSMQNRRFD